MVRVATYFLNCTLFYLPFVVNFFTRSSRGFEDWFSGTITLKEKELERIKSHLGQEKTQPILLPPLPELPPAPVDDDEQPPQAA